MTDRLSPAFVDDPTIEVTDASKWFGQKVAASRVSCSFGPGVTGLLGPNGAGKTTLLRMISGLLLPSEGTVTVLGQSPRNALEVQQKTALVPEEDAVYEFLSGHDYVAYAARLARVPSADKAAAHALAVVELTDAADRLVGEYSKGMRQRAKVATALVADPEILFLDEPLNGTDPVQRARLIELFQRLGAEGRTVLVSSHVLEEVERMAPRVLAMVDGRLAAAGTIAAIRAAMSDIPYRVRIDTDDARRLGAALVGHDAVRSVTVADGEDAALHIETLDLRAVGTDLARLARDLDLRLTRFQPEDLSLESVFRYLVHRR